MLKESMLSSDVRLIPKGDSICPPSDWRLSRDHFGYAKEHTQKRFASSGGTGPSRRITSASIEYSSC